MPMSEKMLLLTGEGKIPYLVYQRASLFLEVLVLSSPLLCPEGNLPVHFCWKSFSVEKLLHLLEENGVRKVCLAGKFPKKNLFERDFLPPEVVKSCSSFQDKFLIQKIMDDLTSKGIEIVSPIRFLSDYLTPPGVLVGDSPEEREWSDIALGCRIASFLADEEIGQTVVVSKGTVLALEGIEGTDETIVRGLTLGRGGVVVKMARTHQD
ncbi:MAG: UDP-2,3-diacylglucosamine diphosphatase LpxI domain-containing protein, partial [Candidatus Caldatribacteriaceae bacterium]